MGCFDGALDWGGTLGQVLWTLDSETYDSLGEIAQKHVLNFNKTLQDSLKTDITTA